MKESANLIFKSYCWNNKETDCFVASDGKFWINKILFGISYITGVTAIILQKWEKMNINIIKFIKYHNNIIFL